MLWSYCIGNFAINNDYNYVFTKKKFMYLLKTILVFGEFQCNPFNESVAQNFEKTATGIRCVEKENEYVYILN